MNTTITINTSEIAREVAQRTSVGQGLSKDIVAMVFETIVHELTEGREVRIGGFGSFTVTHQAERMGRNPRTGEPIAIAAKRLVKLRVSRVVQNAMNPAATDQTRRRA